VGRCEPGHIAVLDPEHAGEQSDQLNGSDCYRSVAAPVQLKQGDGNALMVMLRRSDMRGAPYFGALHLLDYGSPDFDSTMLSVEERIGF